MKDDLLRERAKNRVEFKDHVIVFVVVNAFLWFINVLWSPQLLWAFFVTFFWGLGLLFHWREAYCGTHEERVEQEFRKLKNESKK